MKSSIVACVLLGCGVAHADDSGLEGSVIPGRIPFVCPENSLCWNEPLPISPDAPRPTMVQAFQQMAAMADHKSLAQDPQGAGYTIYWDLPAEGTVVSAAAGITSTVSGTAVVLSTCDITRIDIRVYNGFSNFTIASVIGPLPGFGSSYSFSFPETWNNDLGTNGDWGLDANITCSMTDVHPASPGEINFNCNGTPCVGDGFLDVAHNWINYAP